MLKSIVRALLKVLYRDAWKVTRPIFPSRGKVNYVRLKEEACGATTGAPDIG